MGYQKAPQLQKTYFEKRIRELTKYTPVFEYMLQEPLLLDDCLRGPIQQLILHLATGCETLLCFNGRELAGLFILSNVTIRRRAECIGWLQPAYRGADNFAKQRIVSEFIGDILSYAWNDLGLQKLQARVALNNDASHSFALNMGFEEVGILKQDLQIYNQLFDTVLLEQINPAFIDGGIEERKVHGRKRAELQPTAATSDSGIPAAESIPASGPDGSDADDDDSWGGDAGLELRGQPAAVVPADEQLKSAFFF